MLLDKSHRTLHELRDLQSYLQYYANDPDDNPHKGQLDLTFRSRIEIVLDLLADIFTTITGTQCRLAIKLVEYTDEPKLYAFTFARDTKSIAKSTQSDKKM